MTDDQGRKALAASVGDLNSGKGPRQGMTEHRDSLARSPNPCSHPTAAPWAEDRFSKSLTNQRRAAM